VEPSSTNMTSYSSSGSDCPSSELMQSSMLDPGLNTGTIALTFIRREGSGKRNFGRARGLATLVVCVP
jgi:hypothetical protein